MRPTSNSHALIMALTVFSLVTLSPTTQAQTKVPPAAGAPASVTAASVAAQYATLVHAN